MLPGKRQEDGVYLTAREGGTLIDYDDEDPEIKRRYGVAPAKTGVVSQMPPSSE